MAVPSRHTHPILGRRMESYCAQLPGTQGTSILVACTAHCLTVCRWEYVILSCNKIAFSSVVQSDTVTPACTAGYCMANWLQKYKHKGMHVKRSCQLYADVGDKIVLFHSQSFLEASFFQCRLWCNDLETSQKGDMPHSFIKLFIFSSALHGLVWCLLLANVPMSLYFSLVHQRGPTAVMDFLRKVTSIILCFWPFALYIRKTTLLHSPPLFLRMWPLSPPSCFWCPVIALLTTGDSCLSSSHTPPGTMIYIIGIMKSE